MIERVDRIPRSDDRMGGAHQPRVEFAQAVLEGLMLEPRRQSLANLPEPLPDLVASVGVQPTALEAQDDQVPETENRARHGLTSIEQDPNGPLIPRHDWHP